MSIFLSEQPSHCEILYSLSKGGKEDVYSGRDTKLNRDLDQEWEKV